MADEGLEHAQGMKLRGNKHFHMEEWAAARDCYTQSLDALCEVRR
jgi:hypothetical protein